MRIGDVMAWVILGAVVVMTFFVVHERDMENASIREVIRAEVKAEMDRRYRNVPRISVEKVYTLHATGQDILMDAGE